MNYVYKSIIILLICLTGGALVACKGGSGTGGGGSAASQEGNNEPSNSIALSKFEYPETVTTNKDSKLQLEIRTDDNSAVFYQITSENEALNFKPNAGIIVPQKRKGTLITILRPEQTGTNEFTVTLTNSQNQTTTKTFTTNVTN